jgi:glycolate oxidase iron-sulfur subunit
LEAVIEPDLATELANEAKKCVHCGFCLSACPTYAVTGDESDSPRGRILLLAEAARDQRVTDKLRYHIDRCIGCEACVPACPSGVRYDRMIELAREVVNKGRPKFDAIYREALFAVFPHQGRVRKASLGLPIAKKLSLVSLQGLGITGARLNALLEQAKVVPAKSNPRESVANPGRTTAGRVLLVAGCIGSVYFTQTNNDFAAVASADGVAVGVLDGDYCCGALSLHGGRRREAKKFARKLIDATGDLEDVNAVVIAAAGCGATMKRYGELLRDDVDYSERAQAFSAKVKDATEYLANLPAISRRGSLEVRVGYHDACHLAFAQGITEEPRRLLESIPGVEVVDIKGLNCCGSGGLYSLEEVELAEQIGAAKQTAAVDASVSVIASANPGCTLQLRKLLPGVEVVHPVTLIRRSIEHGT